MANTTITHPIFTAKRLIFPAPFLRENSAESRKATCHVGGPVRRRTDKLPTLSEALNTTGLPRYRAKGAFAESWPMQKRRMVRTVGLQPLPSGISLCLSSFDRDFSQHLANHFGPPTPLR
jgi:hypothetical protein